MLHRVPHFYSRTQIFVKIDARPLGLGVPDASIFLLGITWTGLGTLRWTGKIRNLLQK